MIKIDIEALSNQYRELLVNEGYKIEKPELDNDGDYQLIAKIDGISYAIIFDHDDNTFVKIVLPNFYSLDSDDEKINALIAINHVATRCKSAKIYMNIAQNNMIATIEYLDHGASINYELLMRYFRMLGGAAKEFAEKMKKLN